jgi:hypothetical protein
MFPELTLEGFGKKLVQESPPKSSQFRREDIDILLDAVPTRFDFSVKGFDILLAIAGDGL